jgi:hypothetical protein
MRAEFEAMIVALADAYGAGKADMAEAARLLRARRRGPKEIDDSATLREMRSAMRGTGRRRWSVAGEFAPKAEGNSLNAKRVRLDRKLKELKVLVFGPATEWDDAPHFHGPFALAREAIDEVSRGSRDREVNRMIARRRLNVIPRN